MYFTTLLQTLPDDAIQEIKDSYFKAHDCYMKKNFRNALTHYKQVDDIIKRWKKRIYCQVEQQKEDDGRFVFKPFETPNPVYFHDIAGLDECKQLILEVLVYPTRYPHLVPEKPRGVLGIMLFGYPGCGKSLLAQATSSEINAPFYNVQLSQLQSKYRGESENRVRQLFQTLRKHDVALLFLDEFDAITSNRDGKDSMLAFKNELLVEMSGVNSNSKNNFIAVLAATNMPDMLDPAFLSRFPHKLFVPLPNGKERVGIIENKCKKFNIELSSETLEFLQRKTQGYSGRDIASVLETLRYIPIRRVRGATHFRISGVRTDGVVTYVEDVEGFEESIDMLGMEHVEQPALTQNDVKKAFSTCIQPPRQGNDGIMAFAKKHCISRNSDVVAQENTDTSTSCCVNPFLCCLWGH